MEGLSKEKKEFRRNHYIPYYYLKYFTNSDNHFFVYDKLTRKGDGISYKSPSQVCFEWDRNTFYFPDGKTDSILEMKTYMHFDNLHARTIHDINTSSQSVKFIWTQEMVESLEMFVPLLYWRGPISDTVVKEKAFTSEYIHDAFDLFLVNEVTGEINTDKERHRKMLRDPNMHKAICPTLAYATFGKPHEIYDTLEWRILYENENHNHITSDNPIIFKNKPKEFEDFRSSIIIPIGNNKSLVRLPEIRSQKYHSTVLQDITVAHQAKRYVICSDKTYLKFIISKCELGIKRGILHDMEDALFELY